MTKMTKTPIFHWQIIADELPKEWCSTLRAKDKAILTADRLIDLGLCALVFFLPICNAGIEICVYFTFAVFIFKKLLNPDFNFVKAPAFSFLFIYLFFCGISALHAGPFLVKGLKAFSNKWLKGVFLVMIVTDSLKDRPRFEKVISVLLFSAGLVAVDIFSQRFCGWEFLRLKPMLQLKEGVMAVTGPFIHYNNLGSYLIVVLPMWMAMSFRKDIGKNFKTLSLLFGILTTIGLCLTLSRGAWLGFIGEIVLILFLTGNLIRSVLFTLIFSGLLLSVGPLRDRVLYIFQPGGDSQRFAVWSGAWDMVKEHPFIGKGLGTFMSYFAQYTQHLGIQYAHNCYLQIWAESGIFALLSFVLFTGSVLYAGIKIFRKSSDYLLLGFAGGLFGFSIHTFFDTQLYSLQLVTLFWVISGLILSQL